MQHPHVSGAGVYSSTLSEYKKMAFSPLRTVKEYELELFCDDYAYGFINGERVPYERGVVLIVKPGDRRYSRMHFTCYYLHISVDDPELIARLNSMPTYLRVSDESYYIGIFKQMARLFPLTDGRSPLRMTGLFLLLLSGLVDELSPTALTGSSPGIQSDAIQKVRTLINEHYANDLSLAVLAESVHLNPHYLHKLFTEACGETPLAYLTNVRLYHAKYLLLNSRHTITEISELCGFSTYNYFCSVFKKHLGVSPSEFRKKANHYYFGSSEER